MRLPGCCEPPRFGVAARALERRLRPLTALTVVDARSAQPVPPGRRGEAPIGEALEAARTLYVRMHMAAARARLQAAWEAQVRSRAKGARALDLARLHAYLAAIDDALGDVAGCSRHSEAAVRYDPNLPLDDDIYTPSLQRALKRAKSRRARLAVTIRSRPAGASVLWDGTPVGRTPVTLRGQAKGLHLLRLEHPLAVDWAEAIDLATSVELRPRLVPGSLDQIAAALRARPDLAPQAAELLQLAGVALVQGRAGEGPVVQTFTLGEVVTRRLAGEEGAAASTARAIRLQLERAGRARTDAQARQGTLRSPRGASKGGWREHLRRYGWAYAILGGALIAASVALPLGLRDDPQRRDLLLQVP